MSCGQAQALLSRPVLEGVEAVVEGPPKLNAATVVQSNSEHLLQTIEGIGYAPPPGLVLTDDFQRTLRTVDNVVQAGSQAVAQSNALVLTRPVGADNRFTQLNDALLRLEALGGLAGEVLLEGFAQERLETVNNVVAAGSQAVAQANSLLVTGAIGDRNLFTQRNTARVEFHAGYPEAGGSGYAGDGVSSAVTIRDSAQASLRATNNVVAAGSQAVAQANALALGGGTGDSNRIGQENEASVSAEVEGAGPGFPAGGAVTLEGSGQQGLRAANNVVAAGSQAVAQSNRLAIAGGLGDGRPGDFDNAAAQSNRAALSTEITLGEDPLDPDAGPPDGKAEYALLGTVSLGGRAQRDLEADNNVLAAGSQVAAQSNIIAVEGSTGVADALSQKNTATVERRATVGQRTVGWAADGSRSEAAWIARGEVVIQGEAQAGLHAVNNVLAAGAQVAAQANVMAIRGGVGQRNFLSQANVAVLVDEVTISNAVVAAGGTTDQDQLAQYFVKNGLRLAGSAQVGLSALNNVLAIGSQVAAGGNVAVIGGTTGAANTARQSNTGFMSR